MARPIFFFLLFWTAAADAQSWRVDMPLFPYQGQGNFVIAPARFVSAPVSQAGFIVGAFLCLPVSIAQDINRKDDSSGSPSREASLVCGRELGRALGWPVYAATGLPFFILKETFWDGPKKVVSFLRADAKGPAPKAQYNEVSP